MLYSKSILVFIYQKPNAILTHTRIMKQSQDVSGLTVPFGVSGIKREEFMERARAKVLNNTEMIAIIVIFIFLVNHTITTNATKSTP